MSGHVINVNKVNRCAFCKYWYDPTNSVIVPKIPRAGIWEILRCQEKKKCLKRNNDFPANAIGCKDYVSKVSF